MTPRKPADTYTRREQQIMSFEKPQFKSHNPLSNPIGDTDNKYI